MLWSNILSPKISIWQTHDSWIDILAYFSSKRKDFCWLLKIHSSLNFANRFCKCLLKWQFFVQNYSTITHHNNSASAAKLLTPQKNFWKVLFYSGIILQNFCTVVKIKRINNLYRFTIHIAKQFNFIVATYLYSNKLFFCPFLVI